ncbi:uncharacterized protein LOC141630795 [Silene latifolia]|uniref:uncharacterized protein LOC141630795 n=1 Tax=Silene latifolia TaxID=37657 RepID=UPI003D770D67
MDAFRETLDDCALRDLGYCGNKFTWQRGKSMRTFVRERLDRVVATDAWCELFPTVQVTNFPIYASDHLALIIKECGSEEGQRGGRKQFCFEPFWLSEAWCGEVVKEAWPELEGENVEERIHGCSVKLTSWASRTFGDIKRRLREKEDDLMRWQKREPSTDMLNRCRSIVKEVDGLRMQVETYWYTRAKRLELRDGDKNKTYFHHKAKQRRKKNRIERLEGPDGRVCTEERKFATLLKHILASFLARTVPWESMRLLGVWNQS